MEHQSQDRSESIIIGNCLSCQGLVRVPATAPAKSKVRCPHCSESYPLVQILDQAVPQLELVEESDDSVDVPHVDQILIKTDNDGDDNQKFVVPPQLSKGARRPGRRRSKEPSNSQSSHFETGKMKFGEGEFTEKRSPGSDRRSSSSNRSRSRNRAAANPRRHQGERNTAIELLKVVVGGVLAIPIAYMLVFWFFKQDPLNVGPKLSNVAPFLVPLEFRRDPNDEPEHIPDDNDQREGPDKKADDNSDDLPIPDVDPDRIKPDAD